LKSFHNRLPVRPQSERRDAARRVVLAIAAAAMASGAPARVYAQACPAIGAALPAAFAPMATTGVDPTAGITADPGTAAPTQAAALPTPPMQPTPSASIPAATVGDPGTMTGASPAALTGAAPDAMIGVPPVPPPAPFTVDDPPSPLYPPGTPYPAGVPYPSSVPTQDNLGFYNGPDTSLDAEPMSDFATPSVLK
jgi:hypothetical protein